MHAPLGDRIQGYVAATRLPVESAAGSRKNNQNDAMTAAICLWSGPRNVSTALKYSFAQHDDIAVIDEPLYGHYLRVSGADHPGRNEVLATMNCDGDAVMQALCDRQASNPSPRLFMKHMAHHLVGLDLGFLANTCNIFLVRDPREMLPSLTIQLPQAKLADTGYQPTVGAVC